MTLSSHDPLNLARLAMIAIADKQGRHTAAYDVRERSFLTDYVIIATGQNAPHLKALFTEIRLRLKELGMPCFRKCGDPDSGWIMADYFDIVIHLFLPETREYYALDELLHDAPKIG
ncbi:MAG: ribosome silencing factor [Verrucomicrobia bacterium]|nr:ribosome silencing factor [Verrucomicrobiota bacterium]MCG2679784.1 ribosome silencing factor [Kiritimatiellia bacterium]MBU4247103.1 ribosome silencing factor [Verrucomicrobiota bacterium]MBU4289989.1 ribosome silencing factor [Verrucomicrobiota bacterium]MBU4428652.1 ribosome silencing factor [Verrucomicrobiota bacterium]